MKEKPSKKEENALRRGLKDMGLWDIVALVIAGLLLLNVAFFLLLWALGEQPVLDPAVALLTGLLLLAGMAAGFFAKRKGAPKGVRRLLGAAMCLNALIALAFCVAIAMVLTLI